MGYADIEPHRPDDQLLAQANEFVVRFLARRFDARRLARHPPGRVAMRSLAQDSSPPSSALLKMSDLDRANLQVCAHRLKLGFLVI